MTSLPPHSHLTPTSLTQMNCLPVCFSSIVILLGELSLNESFEISSNFVKLFPLSLYLSLWLAGWLAVRQQASHPQAVTPSPPYLGFREVKSNFLNSSELFQQKYRDSLEKQPPRL